MQENKQQYPDFERSDWTCHLCDNKNFKSRAVCYSYECNVKQSEAWLEYKKGARPDYKPTKVLQDSKDWTCVKCGHFNFKSRMVCFVTGCDMTQEKNRGGGNGEDEDETDAEDDELGTVWEGGHKIGNDRVDCRYADTGGAWRERRMVRKGVRKARMKYKAACVEGGMGGRSHDPMKVLLNAIKRESWGNAFFGVCRGAWSVGKVRRRRRA